MKVRKRQIAELSPLPEGSISLADLMRVRRLTPDADFCRCDPELGEHLSTSVEAAGDRCVIHFVPSMDGSPVHVKALTTDEP